MKDDLPVTVVKLLRECGKDEYWLQDKIYEDPSVLGLGDLERVNKEKVQSSGGRLDLLLKNPEDDSMFEVEVMLGSTDEDHIVRTIVYWDIERRRWGKRNHTAVLVAEVIDTKFINVVHLFSQSIPIIGIQVNAVELEGKLGLHFTKVIDSYEEPEVDDESPPSNEASWNDKSPGVLTFARSYEAFAKELFEDVTMRFRKEDIVVKVGEIDRVWIEPAPPKGSTRVRFSYVVEKNEIETMKKMLEAKGIFPKPKPWDEHEILLEFATERDSLTKYAEEHKKLLLGLDAKGLRRKG